MLNFVYFMYMRKVLFLIVLVSVFLFLPQTAEGHIGLLPFLQVNGVYTQINPAYQRGALFRVAEDVGNTLYIVNSPLHMSVDVHRMPFSAAVAKEMVFRWSFYEGNNFLEQRGAYFYGDQLSYTFDKSGSYLLRLEAKDPGGQSFSLIDTVLLNIIPYKGYVYPKVGVAVQSDNSGHLLFVNKAVFDPSVRHSDYFWNFGGANLEKGQALKKTSEDVRSLARNGILSRVVDDHGLLADMWISQELFTRKLDFSGLGYPGGVLQVSYGNLATPWLSVTPSMAGSMESASGIDFWGWMAWMIWGVCVLVVIFFLVVRVRERKRR